MLLALVYYPKIENEDFHRFRRRYEPYAYLLPAHLTFIFPLPDTVGRQNLEGHISEVLTTWKPFRVHFCELHKSTDQWLFWTLKEGNGQTIQLHDEFYQGMLAPYLREDLPYIPHIGVGLFSKEEYDVSNPTAELTLDIQKYIRAKKEFEDLNLDLWCTVDQLFLLEVTPDFTECRDIGSFQIG